MFGKAPMVHLIAESGSNKDSLQEVLDFIRKIARQVDADRSPDDIVKFKFEPLDDSDLSEEEIVERIEKKCREYERSPILDVSVV